MGRAIAQGLGRVGLKVALLGRSRDKLEETARGMEPGQSRIEVADVADRAAVDAAVGRLFGSLGVIDVLVCNAGINIPNRALASLDPKDWDALIATNLTGAYNLVRAVVPGMRSSGGGHVIQICSISGLRASPLGGIAYSASKFGQAALGICLGREERGRGIRSTVIYPGEVETPILEKRPVAVAPERREVILQPEDVAAAVTFVVQLPARASVPELVVLPSVDDWA
jgi:NADP-dependent 3-hydroxy acid dehydrogenase YdfG